MSVYEERQTRRLLGLDDVREEPDEDLEWIMAYDAEQAADRVEEAVAGWRNPLTGYPTPGIGESPRFRTEQELEYRRWYRGSSPQAARARSIREEG